MSKLVFFLSIINPYNIINNYSVINNIIIILNNLLLNYYFIIMFFLLSFVVFSKLYVWIIILFFKILKLKYFFFKILFYYGTFKIHPLLLYFSIVAICLHITKLNLFINLPSLNLSYIVILTFILGAYWALYQSVWGYFWSNDSIEYILLFFILVILNVFHRKVYSRKYNFYVPFLSLLLLLMSRNGFLFTKHNFFSLLSKTVKLNSILTVSVTIGFIINKKKILKLSKFTNNFPVYINIIFILILLNYLNYYYCKLILKTVFFVSFIFNLTLLNYNNLKKLKIHLAFLIVMVTYQTVDKHFFKFVTFFNLPDINLKKQYHYFNKSSVTNYSCMNTLSLQNIVSKQSNYFSKSNIKKTQLIIKIFNSN